VDELVKAIVSRTGLSEPQARGAATGAIDFLKSRLPAPLSAQLQSALSGGGLGSLGGLLGKR